MKVKITNLFKAPKPIIGMVHLDYLLGQKKFENIEKIIKLAKKDIAALQNNGVNGLLIENWKEDNSSEFISPETLSCLSIVIHELTKVIKIPFGINILNNDFKAAYSLAKLNKASFVQLDVFVDNVKSNFSYSKNAIKSPFMIQPKPQEIISYAKSIGTSKIPLFVFVQPKHYTMLDKDKPIELSAKQAIKAGASAIIVTKETGVAPLLETVQKIKAVSGATPVGIGSGVNQQNVHEFLPYMDFAIVGSSFKHGGLADNSVDGLMVRKMMQEVTKYR